MAKKQEKEIEKWVTVNGARVPIFKDGSVGGPKALRDKVKAVVKEKSSDGKSLKDMSATDIGKEYLNATGERKKALLKELHDRGYRRNKDGSWGKKESDKSGVTRKDVEELTAKKDKLKGTKLKTKPISDEEVKAMKENNPFKSTKDNDTKEKQIARNKKEADERNNQVSDRVKAYQDKFLKKRSVEEIKEIQSNIEKSGSLLGYTESDMVAMRAIENELKERKKRK